MKMATKRLFSSDDEEDLNFQPKRKSFTKDEETVSDTESEISFEDEEEDQIRQKPKKMSFTSEKKIVSDIESELPSEDGEDEEENEIKQKPNKKSITNEEDMVSESESELSSEESEDEEENEIKQKTKIRYFTNEEEMVSESDSDLFFEKREDQEENEIKEESNEDNISGDEEDISEEETSKEDEDSGVDDYAFENNEDNYSFKLDKDQARIFKYVEKLLMDKKFRKENPKVILVNGAAGTGKTKLFRVLCDYVCSELGHQAICTASTGVAALNYKEGRTAHSMFGFPFVIRDDIKKCKINDYNEQVSGASIIIFDAANMTDIRLIKMLNVSLQMLMNTSEMFGGKIMIFGADFLELAPIVSNAWNETSFSMKFSSLLNEDNSKFFSLHYPYRTKKDADYFEYLLKVGSDNFPAIFDDDMEYHVPLEYIKYSSYIDDIIEFVYPADILIDSDLCAKRAVLCSTSRKAQEVNERITKFFAKKIVNCPSENKTENYELFEHNLEELNEEEVFPDTDLELWKGCLCMVIQNMYQTALGHYETLLNGCKVIVKNIQPDIIYVRRPGKDESIPIERKTFRIVKMGKWFVRKQFPLKLCYATTIHRSQGQTLERIGIDLREPVFCHGQLYLALSRVRKSKDVLVCVEKKYIIDGVAYAANVVDDRLVHSVLFETK